MLSMHRTVPRQHLQSPLRLLPKSKPSFVVVSATKNQQYNPHRKAPIGTWFEGWYAKVTGLDSADSFAIGIGHYPDQDPEHPGVACFVLKQTPGQPLQRSTRYFKSLDVVRSAGQNTNTVTFTLKVEDPESKDYCTWNVTEETITLKANIRGIDVMVDSSTDCSENETWSPETPLPEGWATAFGAVLNLHWDVLSLATPAKFIARGSSPATNFKGQGMIHMEKNWGTSFPEEWIWGSGQIRENGQQGSFVLAGGRLPHILNPWIPSPLLYVFSYHAPDGRVLTLDPYDPAIFSNLKAEAADGNMELDLYSPWHIVKIKCQSDPKTFVSVPCPTNDGFTNVSIESFEVNTHITIYDRAYMFAPEDQAILIHDVTFRNSALEFGGAYVPSETKEKAEKYEQEVVTAGVDSAQQHQSKDLERARPMAVANQQSR